MKAHLAFHHRGINHDYHSTLWKQAVNNLGWQNVELEKADVTVMWGPNPEFQATLERGKPVLMVDFPYWNRGWKNRHGTEYYKVRLKCHQPTSYLMKEKHSSDRYLNSNGPKIKPWKTGGKVILLAGMGMKAANQFGHGIGQWECQIAKMIRHKTDMPIIYRPKPRQKPIVEIPGTTLDEGGASIEEALETAHALVCHHGNPTVAALAAGVPIFMNGPIGAASHLASFEFDKIMDPIFPENRQQFFNNLAHWQWSVEEIISGQALMSYVERGFIK